MRRKAADAVHYPDISLPVLKLMGPGEYVLMRPGDPEQGHFGLAAHDYTHSTAPNRRFADLVTQRLLKALAAKAQPPYSDGELDSIARNCTLMEDAARKVERAMEKRMAAVALHARVGQSFSAVVTGVTPKGVFVRVFDPPVEGRLMRGEQRPGRRRPPARDAAEHRPAARLYRFWAVTARALTSSYRKSGLRRKTGPSCAHRGRGRDCRRAR